ncbi:SDR family NAD(P)-dependent oxidoreductase [Micromonosporaceae bacterium DT55]|uniref:SDR family NAD(P)-dependent oxidoreductase n=1 Tax=Melissospora conviva TaxID=3388432 RepID=UPI003C1DB1A9
MRFDGKIAFVAGGASGMGEATVRRLAAEGARVVVGDSDPDRAAAIAADVPGGHAVTIDVGDAVSVEQALAAAMEHHGRLDVIYNGVEIDGEQQMLHLTDVENWNEVRRVNGDGCFHMLKFGIEALLRGEGGVIVSTSSTTGMAGQENISPYTFTKAGTEGLTRAAAIEYARHNIRVNAVAPTLVMTSLLADFIADADDPEEMRRRLETFNPMPGVPAPEDVAAAVAFLASDDARWITGHTLPVDGGYLAR